LGWHPGPDKIRQNGKNAPIVMSSTGFTRPQKKKMFFQSHQKTCSVRTGFEQLSSSIGWRVWIVMKLKSLVKKLAAMDVKVF